MANLFVAKKGPSFMLSQQDLQAWLKPTSEQGYLRIKVDNARRKCCLTLQSQLEAIDCGHHATVFNSYVDPFEQ